jgi:hypothetical protein
MLDAIIQDWLELLPPSLEGPAKVSGWWDGQNNGTGKTENYPPLNPPPPKLKRKKCKAHSVCAWAFPLAA